MLCLTLEGQELSDKRVKVGETVFLPYMKGKIIRRIPAGEINSIKIFEPLASWQKINSPKGFNAEVYSDGNNLRIDLNPFIETDDAIFNKPGSSISFYINDIQSLFSENVAENIYVSPEQISDFMGYPVYNYGKGEAIVFYSGKEPLFLPVTKEEYLSALISEEEKKQKNNNVISVDENLKEMEKAYQQLLRVDKASAEEFRKHMESFAKEISGKEPAVDLLSSLKNELNRLSPQERKKQACYSPGAMEKHRNFSGLVPENSSIKGEPLVKANPNLIINDHKNIYLIVLKMRISSLSGYDATAVRLYKPTKGEGYDLTDNVLFELYNDKSIWEKIIILVK